MFDQHFLKFLIYLLAYHPDEFGLIPDSNEFFKIKEIFQVLIFTKKFKKLNLNILKQAFSFYYKDFFDFLEPLNLVKPKERFFTLPSKVNVLEIYNYNKLWTFVKPKIWFKLSLESEWKTQERMIPLFYNKELAENWAKVKGALLIEVIPQKIPHNHPLFRFGKALFLTPVLLYEFLRGPSIDQKFIKKYLTENNAIHKERIIPFTYSSEIESLDNFPEGPFRKLNKGRKKEKPWKKYQKEKNKKRLNS